MKYLFWIFSLIIFCACMKRGAHCQGTVFSKYNYLVPDAKVFVDTYKSSGKLRKRIEDTTDFNGYFDVVYVYRKGDETKLTIESDSGNLSQNCVTGVFEYHLK